MVGGGVRKFAGVPIIRAVISADLGGRVGWLPKAERVKTLFLSRLWGGGGRGGIPASFPSRSPPPKQPFQPTPTPSPGFFSRRFAKKS